MKRLDPVFWLIFVGWCAALLVAGYQFGHQTATNAAHDREIGFALAAFEAKEEADKRIKQAETDHARAVEAARTDFQKEQEHAQSENNRLIADVRSLRRRLSVPVRCPDHRTGQAGDPDLAGGTGTEGRAELDPRVGEFLISLTERGDNAIRKHAAVVDLYEQLRQTCMK